MGGKKFADGSFVMFSSFLRCFSGYNVHRSFLLCFLLGTDEKKQEKGAWCLSGPARKSKNIRDMGDGHKNIETGFRPEIDRSDSGRTWKGRFD